MNETPEQKAKRIGVPLIPKRQTPDPWDRRGPSQVAAVCGECGLAIPQGPFGYCCPRATCPCGLGGAAFL